MSHEMSWRTTPNPGSAVRVDQEGGALTANADGTLTVTDADSVWFVVAAGTDCADTYPDYRGRTRTGL